MNRKIKRKYLLAVNCPKCHKRGKLFARIEILECGVYTYLQVVHNKTKRGPVGTCYLGKKCTMEEVI